ncbi:hypothetical protein CPB86DRAFT_794542 [Serendipita vermifera]|nr:hypothetical protein CPB86DRAFT_794542 [Serendipita vermifera]
MRAIPLSTPFRVLWFAQGPRRIFAINPTWTKLNVKWLNRIGRAIFGALNSRVATSILSGKTEIATVISTITRRYLVIKASFRFTWLESSRLADVQAAIKFAKAHKVSTRAKGASHAFLGRSSGNGTFAIQTIDLKGLEFNDTFIPAGDPNNTSPQWVVHIAAVAGNKVNRVAPDATAVHPSWRNSIQRMIISSGWIRRQVTEETQKLAALVPGAGCYQNEADINGPNWGRTFWGSNHDRLIGIKRSIDPQNIFTCRHYVGDKSDL